MAKKEKAKGVKDKIKTLIWVEVESSQIARLAWENEALYVEFHSHAVYEYIGVDHDTFQSLLNAESTGKAFHKNIRNNYEYKQLR